MAVKLPLAAVMRIMRKAGKDVGVDRVSIDAAKLFSEELSDIADDLARECVKYAKHTGRKTVKPEDVKVAVKG